MTEAEKEYSSSKSNLTGENLVGKIETLGTALLLLSVTSVFVWMWLEPALQSEKSRSKFMGQKNVNGLIGHWESLERLGQPVRAEGGGGGFWSAHELLTKAANMDNPTYNILNGETQEVLGQNGRSLNWLQKILAKINPFGAGVE